MQAELIQHTIYIDTGNAMYQHEVVICLICNSLESDVFYRNFLLRIEAYAEGIRSAKYHAFFTFAYDAYIAAQIEREMLLIVVNPVCQMNGVRILAICSNPLQGEGNSL